MCIRDRQRDILLTLIKSSHHYHFVWKIGAKCAADFQKMRDKKACETVFGDNNNVGYIINYLLLSDFLWASKACSEVLPLVRLWSSFRRSKRFDCICSSHRQWSGSFGSKDNPR